MAHNLKPFDAVLVTEESIALIQKAAKECGLPVHSSTFGYISKTSPLKYFCFYQGVDEEYPTIGLVSSNSGLKINILPLKEFEQKLFGVEFTIYIPEDRTPVVTHRSEHGITVEFKKKIDFDKITTGSIVKLKYTTNLCWGEWDVDKPVSVVFWRTPHLINSKGNVDKKSFHESYATFIQNGKFILFSTEGEIDFIEEVITY